MKPQTKQLLSSILRSLLKIEHTIYCTTNCRIELPLHKLYYRHRREKYEYYINTTLTPKFDW